MAEQVEEFVPSQAAEQQAGKPPPIDWDAIPLTSDGLDFRNIREVSAFASWLVNQRWAPKDDIADAVAIKILYGRSLGLDWVSAINGLAVVNGRPSIWGKAMLGLCFRSSKFDHARYAERMENLPEPGTPVEKWPDNCMAVCETARVGGGPHIGTFSVGDARQAGLWAARSKSGAAMPWTNYPADMMMWKARSRSLNMSMADVLQGLYSCEDRDGLDKVMSQIDHEHTGEELQVANVTPLKQAKAAAKRAKSKRKADNTPMLNPAKVPDDPTEVSSDVGALKPEPNPTEPGRDLNTIEGDIMTAFYRLEGPARVGALTAMKLDRIGDICKIKDPARIESIRAIVNLPR